MAIVSLLRVANDEMRDGLLCTAIKKRFYKYVVSKEVINKIDGLA